MHEEAREVLPSLLEVLDVHRPILIGHSDGASIALIHAAEHQVAGVVAMAPHVFVEDICVTAIQETCQAYEGGWLRERMTRHHDDPDLTFRGWAGVWLDPGFRAWDLSALLDGVSAPLLLIQGRDDEYGTLAQLDAIETRVPHAVRLVVPGGHSPHLGATDPVLEAITAFVQPLTDSE
jgi:pimeloyl-ACP methyl ester carboxylesterase